jgi:hypothetical protein
MKNYEKPEPNLRSIRGSMARIFFPLQVVAVAAFIVATGLVAIWWRSRRLPKPRHP